MLQEGIDCKRFFFFKTTELLMTYKGNDGSDVGLDILSRATVTFGAKEKAAWAKYPTSIS